MATDDSKPFGLNKNDADLLKSFNYSLKELRNFVIINIEFYHRGKSSIQAKFYATSCILLERTQVLEPLVFDIVPRLHEFDFSEAVQANGYRSFISIVNRCCLHLLQLCRHISINKASLLFRSNYYLRELEAYTETLGQLVACLGYLKQLISISQDGELFVEDGDSVADSLLLEVEMLNTDCFYGRCLGFQFCESIQKVLQAVMVAMATFSECYEEQSQIMQLATSLFNSGKYVVDHDLRAKQVVNTTRTADIKFCKAFWSIPDSNFLHQLRSFTFPHVEVSEVISLPPENFELPVAGKSIQTVTITPACAHTGPEVMKVRLISHAVHEGMQVTRQSFQQRFQPKTGGGKLEVLPPARGLLFHCHGGGFVAQSSKSHENYLRVWARKLQCPILSVDYSLAPDQPFPRALEECFYAYAWTLKHPELVGWTGDYICFAGDSAGANLAISVALRAISYGIRVPDGIVVAYPVTLVQYTPSPARLMSMIDPLLPVGILTRCLAAYAGIADKFSSALAKPIFCNPGKVEKWELVDEEDVTEQSIGAKIVNQNNCDKLPDVSNGQNTGDVGCTNVVKGGDMCSKCGNSQYDEDIDSSESDKSTESDTAKDRAECDSMEELEEDQFVIYDMEELQADSAYQGKIANEYEVKNHAETAESNEDVLKLNGDAGKVAGNERESNTEEQMGSRMEQDVQSESTVQECLVDDNEQATTMAISDQATGIEVDNHRPGARTNAQTVEEALCEIDAAVTICVDTEESKETETDLTEKYATCKELSDSLMVPLESDMRRTVCHSLENIYDDDALDSVEAAGCDKTNDGMKSSVNEDLQVDTGKPCPPSDSLRSGTPKTRKPASGEPDEMDGVNDGQDTFDSLTVETLQEAGSDLQVRFSHRSMSLDLPTTFHPGNPLSPSPKSGSPVSPRLPTGARTFTPKMYSVRRKITQSPIQLFRHLPIVKNLYMSPILAPDELLKALPRVDILACHFDPLLDDSVMFARRLSRLGNPVDLTVFDNLPHGFLSFSDASPEAKQASVNCVEKIMKVLQPETSY